MLFLGKRGNSIWDMGAYAPTTRKNILKISKQKFSTYISIFYVHAPSFAENG
jgi:hypothetical protein